MLKCQTVLVKFMDKNVPMQEVRAAQASYAKNLQVQVTLDFLVVDFVSGLGHIVKQINYNLKDIKEYACEGVEPESPKIELK